MKSSITIYSPEGEDPFANYTTRTRFDKMNRLLKLLKAIVSGGILSRSSSRPSILAGTQYATGTVTLATVSAADTVTINGSALTAANGSPTAEQFDMSGTDAADATSFVNAVNSTSTATLIAGLVRASNLAGTITCSSVAVGDTVTIAGVTFRAVAATPTGRPDEWSMGGTDTADGAALAALINAHPYLREIFIASAASGVVTLRQLPFGSGATTARVVTSSNGTRLAVVAIAATAVVLLCARDKGTEGNCMTLASSNGTRLAVSGARLAGGTDATTLTF